MVKFEIKALEDAHQAIGLVKGSLVVFKDHA